jgi:hypothetical protein
MGSLRAVIASPTELGFLGLDRLDDAVTRLEAGALRQAATRRSCALACTAAGGALAVICAILLGITTHRHQHWSNAQYLWISLGRACEGRTFPVDPVMVTE